MAVLMIGAAVFYVKKEPPTPEFATFSGEKLVVKELYQACADGDRCLVVDTHCGFCCDYTAINARYEQEFNQSFDKNCRRFTGQYCQCFDLSSYPSCVEGKCQLLKWPEAQQQGRAPAPRGNPQQAPQAPARQYMQIKEPAQPAAPAPESQPAPPPPPADSTSRPQDDALFAPLPDRLPDQMPSRNAPSYNPIDAPLPASRALE